MEVKQEPEDPFIEEYKVDFEEHSIQNEIIADCWNYEKDNIHSSSVVKSEFVSIKQENETDLHVDNLQKTCIEVKNEIDQTIDDANIKCNSIELNETIQSKKGILVNPNHTFTKKLEFSQHFLSVEKSSKSSGYRMEEDNNNGKELIERKNKPPAVHTVSKKRRVKCEICSKFFNQKAYLNAHMRIHSEDEMFKCEICSKSFIWLNNLNNHKQIHTDKRPFECDVCSKRFKIKTYLVIHMRLHTGKFKCGICSKSFIKQSNLNLHMRHHTGEKPFQCETCSKLFVDKSTLMRHVRIHSGEKPFKCEICFKSFSDRGHLNKHMRLHAQLCPSSD